MSMETSLYGGGEMGDRIRAFDWSQTSLGPLQTWPQPLCTAVQLVLDCGFPMLLLYGPDLVQLYNDPCRPIMSINHPQTLGQPMFQVWVDQRPILEPLYNRVLQGKTIAIENMAIPIMCDGVVQEAFFTLSLSPVRSGQSAVTGILVTVFDKTRQLQVAEQQEISLQQALAERNQAEAAIRTAEERYHTLFDSIDAGFCIIAVVFDEQMQPLNYRFLEVNSAFENQTGLENPVGRWVRDVMPELEQYWVDIYGQIALTGESQRFENMARDLNRFYDVYAFRVGLPEDHTVAILFSDISERRAMELALAERERILSTLLQISDSVCDLGNEYDIARVACQIVKDEVGAISCSYGFVNVAEGGVHILADICDHEDGVPCTEGQWPLLGGPILTALHQRGIPVMIEDTATHPATAALQHDVFDYIHTRSMLSIPLMRDNVFVAFFAIHDRVPRKYTISEVSLVRDVALRIWDSIQRSHAEEALRASQKRMSLLLHLAQGQRETDDPITMMDVAAEMIGKALHVDRIGFYDMLDDDTARLINSWINGVLPPLEGTFPAKGVGSDMLAYVQTGKTAVMDNIPVDPRTADSLFDKIDTRSGIGVPIFRNGCWRFGIYVHHSQPRQWSAEDVALVEEAAAQTWEAVERAEARKALQRSENRLQKLYNQERAARAEAEQANRLKDDFLATVSHELRTPLTAFLGYAQVLMSRRRDEASARRIVDKMVQSATAQAQMVEDLLDVSRIVSGKMRVELQPLRFERVIHSALDIVQPMIDENHLDLHIDLQMLPNKIMGDPHRLQQVVANLLSNSAKFTPAGGSITVRLEAQDDSAMFSIIDTGQGIKPAFLPFVFERFRQADSSSVRSHSGLGLGLAIVRHLVELHGGTVTASSDGLDKGATFTVRLPMLSETEAELAYVAEAPAFSQSVDLCDLRILVVEDQHSIRDMLNDVLVEDGAVVQVCSSCHDALELVRIWRPDILISDISLPNHDGYWLIKKVRALPADKGGSVPAIALTAYGRLEDRMQVLAAGFQLYIPKPVDINEFRSVVAHLARTGSAE